MNEKIESAREVALSVLKPSPCDREHGMELHRNSIVCESYGFSPRAAVDGEAVKTHSFSIPLQEMERERIPRRFVASLN